MAVLGVNVDHVATLREARKEKYPSPVQAAQEAQEAGAEWIVAHLREDRRHIQERDIYLIRRYIKNFNMEMAVTPEMLRIACRIKPDQVTLVPERRKELTTEGGLDVVKKKRYLKEAVERLKERGIIVSFFIDPSPRQIEAVRECLGDAIEIHTGHYANRETKTELEKIRNACILGLELGFKVNVGHGLNYKNVRMVSRIKGINEFNIGHSIVSRAVFVGMKQAVKEMIELIC